MHAKSHHLTHAFNQNDYIHATELPYLAEQIGNPIKVISLDCFDTLLWRKTASPIDVFYDLQHKPTFKKLDFTADSRLRAETLARRKMLFNESHNEITLFDIYQANFTHLKIEQINALIDQELEAEIDACYAFNPVVEFMRATKARGFKIIIVSDTYLRRSQLQKLLQHKLPLDVMAMIDHIFCSCDWKKSKATGLFAHVLDEIKQDPSSLLHIGDHPIADLNAASKQGIHALQLVSYDKSLSELFRMQTLSAIFMDHEIRSTRSFISPFKGVLASTKITTSKPETLIGYASLGPLMYSFSHFLRDEFELLSRQNNKVKILFLMRDAYLPSLCCEALIGKKVGANVCISRFSSYAASFRTKDDVDDYLINIAKTYRFHDACRQLLLPDDIANSIIEAVKTSQQPDKLFIQLIQQPRILDIIFSQSLAYFERLKKHLINEVGLEKGDTLIFVDLGYTGTAQHKLTPIFRKEMEVDIIGRYFLALHTSEWKKSKRGLIDPSCCDNKSLSMLVTYIALLEQLCTLPHKSVVDYDEKGQPIYSDSAITYDQYDKLKFIHHECVRFINDATIFFENTFKPTLSDLRSITKAELCRLLFFHSETELAYLQTFNFDLNLGTQEIIPLFDVSKGITGLRRRGLHFMENNLNTMRTNYPAELRSAGLELTFTLMLSFKLGLNLRTTDLSLRRETVHVIARRDQEKFYTTVQALPTYDGYYALIIPICNGNFKIDILFGKNYHWLQTESVEYINSAALLGNHESEYTKKALESMTLNTIIEKHNGLFECLTDAGSIIFNPPNEITENDFVLRIIFRPIVIRNRYIH